eukprot:ctg_323.g139
MRDHPVLFSGFVSSVWNPRSRQGRKKLPDASFVHLARCMECPLRFRICRRTVLCVASKEPESADDAGEDEDFAAFLEYKASVEPELELKMAQIVDYLPPVLQGLARTGVLDEWNTNTPSPAPPQTAAAPFSSPSSEAADGTLSGSSFAQLASDYHVPLEWVLELLVDIGFSLPIRPQDSLVRMNATAEQVGAFVDRIHGVGKDDVYDWYVDETLEELAEEYDVPLVDMMEAAIECGVMISLGPATHMRREQKERVFGMLGIYWQRKDK